jgi:tetratricopeptide (TPR) repeat protein
LWRDLSLHLLETGHEQQARDVASHVMAPYELVAMQADNRFHTLVRSAYVSGNARKAADEEIRMRRDAVSQQPRSLERVVALGTALLRRLRAKDVVDLTEGVMRNLESKAPGTIPYDDIDSQLGWIYNLRARALRDFRRNDEALELLRRAANTASTQNPVSHTINLAIFLCDLDRPQDALAGLPDPEKASDYGRLMIAQVRVMAATELGDVNETERALTEAQRYSRASLSSFQRLLVIAGKDREAGDLLLARLQDPERRADALIDVQNYVDPPAPPTVLEWRSHAKAIRERADVRALIGQIGKISDYPLRLP